MSEDQEGVTSVQRLQAEISENGLAPFRQVSDVKEGYHAPGGTDTTIKQTLEGWLAWKDPDDHQLCFLPWPE